MVLSAANYHLRWVPVMEACGIRGEDQIAVNDYEFVSCPNRSLSPWQQRLAFWGLALPCMGIAGFFASLGYWLMMPFAGLEVGLLAWAFENIHAHDEDYESIKINGDRLLLEWHRAGKTHKRELNTHWAKAKCVCEQFENNCRFCVHSLGEAIELGRYLNDQGRIKLAEALRVNLTRHK